jgi:predicted phosphodiesterase
MSSRKKNQLPEEEPLTPVEAARERLVARQHNALERSFYEEHGKMLEIFDGLAKSIQALPVPKIPKPTIQSGSRRAIVLLYSDSHCGLHVDPKRLGGFGGFNESIWRARHECLRTQVTLAQKMFQVDDFVCLALGDLIDGQDIFKSQPFEIDHNVPEQMVLAAQQFGADLTYYAGLFRNITVSCVFGNHGRKGRFGENPYAVNYEQVVYELAKAYAGNCENILWSINEAWFQLVDILGTTFLTMHGDDVRGTAATLMGNAAKVRAQYKEMTGCQFDYLCLGHHHRHLASEDILINGSFVGASEFTAKNLRSVSMPSQKLLVIEEGIGITWSANLPLASWSELRNVETFYSLA